MMRPWLPCTMWLERYETQPCSSSSWAHKKLYMQELACEPVVVWWSLVLCVVWLSATSAHLPFCTYGLVLCAIVVHCKDADRVTGSSAQQGPCGCARSTVLNWLQETLLTRTLPSHMCAAQRYLYRVTAAMHSVQAQSPHQVCQQPKLLLPLQTQRPTR